MDEKNKMLVFYRFLVWFCKSNDFYESNILFCLEDYKINIHFKKNNNNYNDIKYNQYFLFFSNIQTLPS